MTDIYLEKLKEQLEMVLKGEANLLEAAHKNNLDIDRVEQQIKDVLAQGVIFGTGDPMTDLMMACYWTGRRHQFMASSAHFFGQQELQAAYTQMCIKLGIQPKRLN